MAMESLSARIGKGMSFTRPVHDDERASAIRALGREDEIQARVAEQLADRMKPGGVVYFLGVFLVGIPTGLHTQQTVLFIVFAVLQFLAASYRWYWTHSFSSLYAKNPVSWRRGLALGANLSAVFWAAFASFVILEGAIEGAMVSVAGSSGLAAGGAVALAPDRRVLKQFLALLLLPSAVTALCLFDTLGFSMAAALLIFALYFYGLGMRQHRAYWTALYDDELLRKQAKELEQARREAEASIRSKDAFLATMSHELRTPMNAVIGAGDLLLATSLSSEQEDYAQTILAGGNTLLGVINDILDFSKIQADKLELEHNPFDVRHCIEAALDLVSIKAAEKGLDLGFFVDFTVPPLLQGDHMRLRQIMINLVGNAVKFTEQGQVMVHITSRVVDASEAVDADAVHEIKITVSDTGIGIAAERLDQLFKPFSQADSSTTRRYGGTGLGLSISRLLAERMGGTIWAESEEGIGSTFYCTIRTSAVASPVPGYLQANVPGLVGKRVLLIDNNTALRGHLDAYLTLWGLEVHAKTTAQATSAFKTPTAFDLLLVDHKTLDAGAFVRLPSACQRADGSRVPLVTMGHVGLMKHDVRVKGHGPVLSRPIKPRMLYALLLDLCASTDKKEMVSEPGERNAVDEETAVPLRILLAEDNLVNKKIVLHLLTKLGCQADWVGTGRDVIRRLECEQYDLVLMDMQMPEMDGLEATQRICSRWNQSERPPIVALTANALPEDKERCLEAGMDGYLSKPIKLADLRTAVRRWGGHEQPGRRYA